MGCGQYFGRLNIAIPGKKAISKSSTGIYANHEGHFIPPASFGQDATNAVLYELFGQIHNTRLVFGSSRLYYTTNATLLDISFKLACVKTRQPIFKQISQNGSA
jgi:hypothetical protein